MQEIANCLIKEANLAGGRDNIAVTLVNITRGKNNEKNYCTTL